MRVRHMWMAVLRLHVLVRVVMRFGRFHIHRMLMTMMIVMDVTVHVFLDGVPMSMLVAFGQV